MSAILEFELGSKIATREAYGQTLAALAEQFPNLVVLDADLSGSTQTKKFAAVAPERFINCGIAEQDMIGVASGLSTCGKIPFCSSFAVFASGRAFEQIRNSVCYGKLNVKIAATHAGVTVGEDGGTHQAVADIAIMRTLPGMTVIVPADATETAWAVRAAAEHQGPVYLRLGRLATPVLYPANTEFTWGKGQLLRPGSDLAIFACGMMVNAALEAAELLAAEGVKAAVADVHTIKPLDTELISSLATRCGAAMTVEEGTVIGGLGSAVAEVIAERRIHTAFARVGLEDTFGQSGSPAALLKLYGLDPEAIANRAKAVLAHK